MRRNTVYSWRKIVKLLPSDIVSMLTFSKYRIKFHRICPSPYSWRTWFLGFVRHLVIVISLGYFNTTESEVFWSEVRKQFKENGRYYPGGLVK